MKYTTLGKTSLRVSRIALGCMSYGSSKWRAWVKDEADARPFFKAALDAGVTFFDTANMYSNGASEEVTGRALGDMAARDQVVIATKVFYAIGSTSPQAQGLSRQQILKACDDSLRRLGTDYIDLYQIHRWDPHTPLDETLEALSALVTAGKVRYIGASSGWAWRMMKALSISERNGWAKFASMQNHYNALYREEEREMMPLCRSEGVGVIPWSPLARGILTRPRPSTGSVKTADSARSSIDTYSIDLYEGTAQWDIVDAIERIAKTRGVPMAEISLAWLLAKPGVTAPIIGATKISHLESAVAGVELTLSAEEIAAIDAPYRAQPVRGHED
jgi:aryl-alcohol dehydrogenase-like predicted oxidoreductase